MISLWIISVILYIANKYYFFAPNLTPMGIFRRLPYYMGYVFGQDLLFRDGNKRRDLIGCPICLCMSILFFHWHLHAFRAGQHILHIALFYPSNIGFLFSILYGCKQLSHFRPQLIINLSIGTLVIIGLHVVFITLINYMLGYVQYINGTICYHWYEALPITIAIVGILYPVILWTGNHSHTLISQKSK